MQPLKDVRVLAVTVFLAGPFLSMTLARFGADVIKVEPPGGDVARRWGPFPGDVPHPEKSGFFHFLNTNKKGITLDIEKPAGRELFGRLVAEADVVIENNLPSAMREQGLDYPAHPGNR